MRYALNEEYPFRMGKSWKDFRPDVTRSSSASTSHHHVILKCLLIVVLTGFFLYLMTGEAGWAIFQYEKAKYTEPFDRSPTKPISPPVKFFSKKDVQKLLKGKNLLNLQKNQFDITIDSGKYRVVTTIDSDLQQYIMSNLDISYSRYIGIVVMKPETGKIISMVSFDKTNPDQNACLNNQFPAASVFKIVTAAAAIEQCGFNSDSTVAYSGQKYTLYKSQISNNPKHKPNFISFQDSFAQSINPVFGKIGAQYLEKNILEEYAQAFGFNRKINFELPFEPSFVSISEEPYQRAEIASGFNRETTISPLHGALMTSAILNQGRLVEPIIIDSIRSPTGEIVYRSAVTVLNQAISPNASKIIENLMEETVQTGTGKRFFQHRDKDDVLSRLTIGAKTGTINGKDSEIRFDWFVGFASEKGVRNRIALSVVIAHEKLIGTRSGQYARMIIEQYFKNSIR